MLKSTGLLARPGQVFLSGGLERELKPQAVRLLPPALGGMAPGYLQARRDNMGLGNHLVKAEVGSKNKSVTSLHLGGGARQEQEQVAFGGIP